LSPLALGPGPDLDLNPCHRAVEARRQPLGQFGRVEADPAGPGGTVHQDHHRIVPKGRAGHMKGQLIGQQGPDAGIQFAGLLGPGDQFREVVPSQ
jgi:hypothetical protein